MIDIGHAAFVALRDTEAPVVPLESYHVAGCVVGGERLLRRGVPAGDQPVDFQGRPAERAVTGEAVPDMAVDAPAQCVARRHEAGVLAGIAREPEPARGGGAGEIVRLDLGDALAELLERAAHVSCEARAHGFLQLRVFLPEDFVHDGGLHARALELGEGLAGIDRVELLLVADQHHARDAQGVRDAEQIPGLDGGGERALVDYQHGFAEDGVHSAFRFPGEAALGDPGVACQEPLQGLALDAGLGSERACGRRRRSETDDAVAALFRQDAGTIQHRGLAGAGIPLHADHPIPCREDEMHRFLLPHGQPSIVQPRSHHPAPHNRLRCASAALHECDDLLFVGDSLVGGERVAQDLRTGCVQGARLFEPTHGLLGGVD